MKVVLDSTAIVSFFSDKDKFHAAGIDVFSSIIDRKIEPIIPSLAMVEACGIISRNFGQHLAAIVEEQLNGWIDNGMLSVKELTLDRMRYAAQDAVMFGIKGADAVFVALSKEMSARLVTFDEELKKKVKGKVDVYEI